jgi:hypothetical protein
VKRTKNEQRKVKTMNNLNITPKNHVSVAEFASKNGLSTSTVYRNLKKGKLVGQSITIFGRSYYEVDEVASKPMVQPARFAISRKLVKRGKILKVA